MRSILASAKSGAAPLECGDLSPLSFKRRRLLTRVALLVWMAAAPLARGADLLPLPSFTNHEVPDTQNPATSAERMKYLEQTAEAAGVELCQPRAGVLDYLDIAALVGCLSLASYFALVRRSRRGLFLLAIASLLWLGFWRKGCVCPIGAIQNVTLAMFDSTYAVPLTVVAFFVLPLAFTLFFGRSFCASVCPLGAVQELVALRPVRVPAWLDHTLGLLAYVYLGAAVALASTGTAFIICRYDPFVGLFRMSGGLGMLLVGAGFLAVGIFVGRPYCRWLCPYGAILGLLSKVSWRRVRIPPKDCIQCKLCEDACPYGAIRGPTVVQPVGQRRKGRRRLAAAIVLLPVLPVLGYWVAAGLGPTLARLHPNVQLAEQMWLEDNEEGYKEACPANDATDNFRNTGRDVRELYGEAAGVITRTRTAAAWLGGWAGLVIGVKLIHLAIRRRRTEYQPDPASCVSCGRCFWYCPNEQARQGWIQGRLC
jgi:NosR/NirI family transcriptional regulator, nitrous oxide reductase regulator